MQAVEYDVARKTNPEDFVALVGLNVGMYASRYILETEHFVALAPLQNSIPQLVNPSQETFYESCIRSVWAEDGSLHVAKEAGET